MPPHSQQVLAFYHTLIDVDGFEAILSSFIDNGYKVSRFNVEQEPDFHLHTLPAIIGEMADAQDIKRITIVSNIRTAVLSWFRMCNRMADDYVYFIDKPGGGLYREQVQGGFFDQLATFAGIADEDLVGKIYLNMNYENHTEFSKFLFAGKNINFFEHFRNFDFEQEPTQGRSCDLQTQYILNGELFSFSTTTSEGPLINIDIAKLPATSSQRLNLELPVWAIPYSELIGFPYVGDIVDKFTDIERKSLFQDYHRISVLPQTSFELKLIAAYAMYWCKFDHALTAQVLMNILLTDDSHMNNHYEICICLTHILYEPYPEYYLHRRQELDKLAEAFLRQCNRSVIKKHRPSSSAKRVAFILHRISMPEYAPTRIILNHILALVELGEIKSILLVVEDVYFIAPVETKLFMYRLTTPHSMDSYINSHQDVLNRIRKKTKLELFRSDVTKSRFTRMSALLKEVRNFEPDCIVSDCADSVCSRILFNEYPVMFFCMANEYTYAHADCYLVPNIKCMQELNTIYGGLVPDSSVQENSIVPEVPMIGKEIPRSEVTRSDDDIVVVTASNRLDCEMDGVYIDAMYDLVCRFPRLRWLLAGSCKPGEYFYKKCVCLLEEGRVVYRGLEANIVALLSACDIYSYPTSATGGGMTLFYAMSLAKPVVLMGGYFSDGGIVLGEENVSGASIDEYTHELERLIIDEEYRSEMGKRCKQRTAFFSRVKAGEVFTQGLHRAIENFGKRMNFTKQ